MTLLPSITSYRIFSPEGSSIFCTETFKAKVLSKLLYALFCFADLFFPQNTYIHTF